MTLSKHEKDAGRWFRDTRQAELTASHADSPPTYAPPPWLRHYRHPCAKRRGVSTSLELKEVYVPNPEIWGCYCGAIEPFVSGHFPHEDCQGGVRLAAAGRFAFIYKEGRCSCGATARSKAGRLVDAVERPPVTGRVARN